MNIFRRRSRSADSQIPRKTETSECKEMFLKNVVTKFLPEVRAYGIAIAGKIYSGRNTLAARLGRMLDGPLVGLERLAYRETMIDLNERPLVNRRGIIKLQMDIFHHPDNQRERDLKNLLSYFKGFVFILDVKSESSFDVAIEWMNRFKRLYNNQMPGFIIVGNKIDTSRGELDPLTISSGFLRFVARREGAQRYYECSAKENTNVGPVLDNILEIILQ